MGYQKNSEPLSLKDKIKIGLGLILMLCVFIFGIKFTVEQENKMAAKQALKEAAYVHPDTLYISRDLHNEDNLVRFVDDEYPLYVILEYKHIDSEYSAWNGTHNFYEFILIKKQ